MREELIALREELYAVKDKLRRDGGGSDRLQQRPVDDESYELDEEEEEDQQQMEMSPNKKKKKKRRQRQRQRRLEKVGRDVEVWAKEVDSSSDGWKEISCNNFVKKKFNGGDRTQVYLKVRDPNTQHAHGVYIMRFLILIANAFFVSIHKNSGCQILEMKKTLNPHPASFKTIHVSNATPQSMPHSPKYVTS